MGLTEVACCRISTSFLPGSGMLIVSMLRTSAADPYRRIRTPFMTAFFMTGLQQAAEAAKCDAPDPRAVRGCTAERWPPAREDPEWKSRVVSENLSDRA